jgi:hypothetical protein
MKPILLSALPTILPTILIAACAGRPAESALGDTAHAADSARKFVRIRQVAQQRRGDSRYWYLGDANFARSDQVHGDFTFEGDENGQLLRFGDRVRASIELERKEKAPEDARYRAKLVAPDQPSVMLVRNRSDGICRGVECNYKVVVLAGAKPGTEVTFKTKGEEREQGGIRAGAIVPIAIDKMGYGTLAVAEHEYLFQVKHLEGCGDNVHADSCRYSGVKITIPRWSDHFLFDVYFKETQFSLEPGDVITVPDNAPYQPFEEKP